MRLRREQPIDPETIRELEAFEAEFADVLLEERPQPRPEFALDLDLRARDGFPAPEPTKPAKPSRRVVARRWRLALPAAALVFIVATGVISSGVLDSGGGGEQPEPALELEDAPTPGQREALDRAGGGATAAPATSPPLPSPPGVAPRARERQVERAASLTLAAPRDRIEETADEAIRVTDRHGGFVLSSSVSSGDGAEAGAALDLRVPSERVQRALADLSELAHVRARTQDARDITAAFTSPRRRLADALAERRGLLRRLAGATTPNETAAIRARLRATNRRINRAQAELRRLRERVTFSAVAVTIEPGSSSAANDGGWTLGDALDDALGVLRAVVGAAFIALAVLIPAALLAAVAFPAYRLWLRRRRERALEM